MINQPAQGVRGLVVSQMRHDGVNSVYGDVVVGKHRVSLRNFSLSPQPSRRDGNAHALPVAGGNIHKFGRREMLVGVKAMRGCKSKTSSPAVACA